jgi:hypothetical protein
LLTAYLRLQPTGEPADAARLALDLMHPKRARSSSVARTLDTASSLMLYRTIGLFAWWPDSAETALRIARRLVERPYDPNLAAEPTLNRSVLTFLLAWRGHFKEAAGYWDGTQRLLFAQWALLGGVPRDTATAVFDRLLRAGPTSAGDLVSGLPWWAQHGDSVSLARVIALTGKARGWESRFALEAARGYLELVRGDTTRAIGLIGGLDTLPNPGRLGAWERYVVIQLLNRQARYREAASRLNRERLETRMPRDVLLALERGRSAEGLGDRARAITAYSEVLDTGAHADSSLEPIVAVARAAVKRLGKAPP